MIYFIIIYGTYGITYSKGNGGNFHCPTCSHAHPYRHRRVRRFFHFFFIPLIPLNLAGEYIECNQCRGTYRLDVLALSDALATASANPTAATPAKPESEAHRATRRMLVLMILADGRVEEAEITTVVDILRNFEGRDVTRDEVLAEIEAARREPADVEAYCRSAMGYLNEEGKHQILHAAQAVAGADGHVDPAEQHLLERIGIALGLRPAQVTSSLSSPALPAATQPRAPFCGTCGGATRWHADHHRWGCDHCRAFVDAA